VTKSLRYLIKTINQKEKSKMIEVLTEYLAKGFMTMLSISMPCVLTAAAIGLVVGIIQAVTQVQEQTIAAAPKIFMVFLKKSSWICTFAHKKEGQNVLLFFVSFIDIFLL
jgi:type III secretory pathway component EscS